MDKIRTGIIGVGNMGKNHVRLISEMKEQFDLGGVFDVDKDRIIKSGFVGRIYQSVDDLIGDVEAVIIAAPSFLHKELALKAAENNLHLLVEKPLALNRNDGDEICAAYQRLDKKILMVGHVERFNPAVQELEKILDNERVLAIEIERCSPMDKRINDTDVIYDLMIHDIDILLNAIMPGHQVKKLHAFGRTSYNEKYADYVQAIFKFDNNVQASIISSRTTEDKIRKISIHCSDAFIRCDLLHKTINISRRTHYKLDTGYSPVYKQENVIEQVFVPNVEPLKMELLHFANCIRNKSTLLNDGVSAARDLEYLDQIKLDINLY